MGARVGTVKPSSPFAPTSCFLHLALASPHQLARARSSFCTGAGAQKLGVASGCTEARRREGLPLPCIALGPQPGQSLTFLGVGVVFKRSGVSCWEGGGDGGKSVGTLPGWVWTSLCSVCHRCLSQVRTGPTHASVDSSQCGPNSAFGALGGGVLKKTTLDNQLDNREAN